MVGWRSAVLTSGAADRARLMHAWAQAPVFDEGKQGRQQHTKYLTYTRTPAPIHEAGVGTIL